MKILIVDDNQSLADGLAIVLEIEGHTVNIVYSGEDIVEISLYTSLRYHIYCYQTIRYQRYS